MPQSHGATEQKRLSRKPSLSFYSAAPWLCGHFPLVMAKTMIKAFYLPVSSRKLARRLFRVHDKSIQHIARAHDDVVIPIQLIRDRAVADGAAQTASPQRIARPGIQRHKVIRAVAREDQIARRAQRRSANRRPPMGGSSGFCPSCNRWPASWLPATRRDLCRPSLAGSRRGRRCNRC